MSFVNCLFLSLNILTQEASHLGLVERDHLSRLICQESPDPLLSLAIAKQESGFKRDQVSKTKDYGIFQINSWHIQGPGEVMLGDWPRQTKKHSKLLKEAIEAGDWGYYHSRTPEYLDKYKSKVSKIYLKFKTKYAVVINKNRGHNPKKQDQAVVSNKN